MAPSATLRPRAASPSPAAGVKEALKLPTASAAPAALSSAAPAALAPGGGGNRTLVLLALLFVSSLGEVYFPDVMKLNQMPARTNWFFIAHALGNAAVVLLPSEGEGLLEANWRAASIPALMDIASYAQLFAGVALAGAQTKSILYSSSILWSAVLSSVLLGKVLSRAQWGSIALLFVGLTYKSLGGSKASSAIGGSSFLLGVALILTGCFTHALVNVKNEALIKKGKISAKVLCVVIGIYALAGWLLLYACGLIIPELNGQQWVFTRAHFSFASLSIQDAAAGVPMRSGAAWFGFVLATAVHAGSFFSLLGSVGTVSSGIVKGMTTSTYVLLSGLAFCGLDGNYCLTSRTLISAAICAISVVCYSLASKRAQARASATAAQAAAKTQPATAAPGSEEVEERVEKLTAKEESLRQRTRSSREAMIIGG